MKTNTELAFEVARQIVDQVLDRDGASLGSIVSSSDARLQVVSHIAPMISNPFYKRELEVIAQERMRMIWAMASMCPTSDMFEKFMETVNLTVTIKF